MKELLDAVSKEQAYLFLEAPDIYYAAAIMHDCRFVHGKGDRTVILDLVLKNGEKYPAIKEKLIILQSGTFKDSHVYRDTFKVYLPKFSINKSYIKNLWVKLVKKHATLSN
jgi:hypothetical protein